MNEKQYLALCEACDRILMASDSSIERVAIPWLHIVREHPVFLRNYEELFEASGTAKGFYRHLSRVLRNRASVIRQIGGALLTNRPPWYVSKELPKRIDLLFISHLLKSSQASNQDDFYFGSIPEELHKKGRSSVVALINHSRTSGTKFKKRWKEGSVPRLLLSNSLGVSEEIRQYIRLVKESYRLRKLKSENASDLSRRIIKRASEESLSGRSLSALRIFSQLCSLTDALQPRAIVVTYEGHAWERLAFAAAMRFKSNVQRLGYQHSAVFRLQHAIRRTLLMEYNPCHIFTSGAIGKNQLERAPSLKTIPISVLGSNRTYGRGNEEENSSTNRLQSNSSCLVIPEGELSECYILFEFSLACAHALPDINFIWRLHPLVTFKTLSRNNSKLRNFPRNVVLSSTSLEEDTRRCRWALYRGTTAVIQAVVAGLRPIYLQSPREMNIDPLYELKEWRICVRTKEEFVRVIRSDLMGNNRDYDPEWLVAKAYCRDFFKPLNPSVLESAVFPKSKSGGVY